MGEREVLVEFLDYQRDALVTKVSGLSEAQARSTPTVSALSLLAIVKHSAVWERRWFQVIGAGRRFPGEWPVVDDPDDGVDHTFDLADDETVASVVADYRREIAAANVILAADDLDRPCGFGTIPDTTLRWIALHMIEETARHAGHADIIRESIDGQRDG